MTTSPYKRDSNSPSTREIILSINRFEGKKNIGLAIDAFVLVRRQNSNVMLVLAGGYDARVNENVQVMKQLEDQCLKCGLLAAMIGNETKDTDVIFVPSFSLPQRSWLLENSACLVYTPSNEHFGIVPLEAMLSGVPVVAVASGGPIETIIDGKTGFLCQPNASDFSAGILRVLDPKTRLRLGNAARIHVASRFSMDAFCDQLHAVLVRSN